MAGGIIWLASFPKSGNTWFRILLANLASGDAGPADINNLVGSGGIASSRHEFETATMLDSGLLSPDDIDCLRPLVYAGIAGEAAEQRWIKVHDAYTVAPSGEPLLGRGLAHAAVYLTRDPRDVAVSLAHHNGTTIDFAIALMNSSQSTICGDRQSQALQLRQKLGGWSNHVTSWLDQCDTQVFALRFEDLAAAPAPSFAAALAFAGRAATSDEIERAVRNADFAELQRQERARGFVERPSPSNEFFRTGRVGGWREALTAGQARSIVDCHGAVMARLGYVA